MARSILGTIGLAVTVAFAIPVAMAGVDLFGKGQRLLGGGLVGIAVLMVVVEEYVTTPTDLPGKVAERTVGSVVKEPDDEE